MSSAAIPVPSAHKPAAKSVLTSALGSVLSDITIRSPRCLLATIRAPYKFDTKCWGGQSLYFASIGQVCDTSCLDSTIAISQFLTRECDLDKMRLPTPLGYNHTNAIYISWADERLANLVCKGSASGNDEKAPGHCFSKVFGAQSMYELGKSSPESVDKTNVCSECTKEWVELVANSTAHLTPILYYGHIPDSNGLARWIGEQCGYAYNPAP
ncbi:hypothetical protein EC988_000560 [Linderina pennispora]|nr:hypothetical protein EC988_000560 [Linderina pennispora]